jgi:twinkle protein
MVIALERNQQAEDETKNHTRLRVLKNRLTGESGVAGVLVYDRETGRMRENGQREEVNFEQQADTDRTSDFR